MVFESLNFDDVALRKCEEKELYFKVKGQEMLLVNLVSPTGEPLINDNLQVGEELEVLTNSTNQIVYRLYDSNISNQTMLCDDVPLPFPQVVDEYLSGEAGSVLITKQLHVRGEKSQPNSFSVAYNFSILLQNIVLNQGQQQTRHAEYAFRTCQA